MRHLATLAAFTLGTTLISTSSFAADYLAAEAMGKIKMSLDGMLREWPTGFDKLKTKNGSPTKSSVLVGYDDKYIYLGAKIDDKKIVRSQSGSKGEDQLVLDLVVPGLNGRDVSYKIAVFPGDPGKLPGLVQVNGKNVADASAIEAPTSDGFTLEARIPWSALPATSQVRIGMRGKVSYHDASSAGRIQSVSSTSSANGGAMPPLTTAPETGLIQTLLEPERLSLTPAKSVYGDLTGQGSVERVALYGNYLSIVGPGYKGGTQFYYNELDVVSEEMVTRLELVDFNNDQKSEIVIQKRLGGDDKYREVIQVLQLGKDGAPLQVFIHEVAIVTDEGRIENQVTIKRSGKTPSIEIAQGKTKGFEPGSYREPTLGVDVPSALLPWQSVQSRTFAWSGGGLTAAKETSWEPKMVAPSRTNTKAAQRDGAVQSSDPNAAAPPPPRPPSSDEMLDRVYALYKSDRGINRQKKPSFDFVTDVAEDEQMERVVIHDRDLLVFGKGFMKGLSYTYLTIGVKDSKDILSVTTRDLVGDGKAEIIVHAVLNAEASKSLGGDIVGRQALFIYKVTDQKLTRIFAAETGRALKENRILSAVAFLPSSSDVTLELRPLRAVGWTQKTYPFPEDQHPAGGLEPLLLPWGNTSVRRYSFDGSSYALQ